MHRKTLSMNSQHLVLMAKIKDAPFKCLICKKVFISGNHLKRHEDRRHSSKITSTPPEQVKEGTINETANESTIKAVLNATERIEDLLIKLAIRENDKNTNIPRASSSPGGNFDDSLVTSSSFTTEKNEQNIENCKYILNGPTTNKKQTEITKLKYNEDRNLNDSIVTTSSSTTHRNEQNVENDEFISNYGISNNKQKDIERSISEHNLVTFNSEDTNEQNIENCKYFSNDSTFNKISKMAVLKNNETSIYQIFPVASYSYNPRNNDQNIKNYRHSLNDSLSNKHPKNTALLNYNERSDFKDIVATAYSLSNGVSSTKKQKDIAELKCDSEDNLVNTNSYYNDKIEQNIENYEYYWNNSTSHKKTEDVANFNYNESSNFKDIVGSTSFSTEKNEHNNANCEYLSKGSTSNKKQKGTIVLKYNESSDLEDNIVTSHSFTIGKCEQNIENYELLSNNSMSSKKSKKIANFNYNEKSDSNDIVVATNSEENKPNIDQCEYLSNGSTPNKKQKDSIVLKYNERSDFEDNIVTSNSFTIGKFEENVENYELLSNNSMSSKKSKEIERSDSKDNVVATNFEENEPNIDKCEYLSNDSTSNKKQMDIFELKYNENSDFEDNIVTYDSFTNEKDEKNINCEYMSNVSSSNKKQSERSEFKYTEKSDFEDSHVGSDFFASEKSEQNMESSERISFRSIPLKKAKGITRMTCNDFLEEQENKAIWRITSSIIKSSNFSLEVLDPTHADNHSGSGRNELTTLDNVSFRDARPMMKCRSSLRSEILRKLDSKLESYGVNPSQNTLSDKDVIRIGNLLKEERNRVAKEIPDYFKLRQLIKDHAHRRIKENLQVHSTYVS